MGTYFIRQSVMTRRLIRPNGLAHTYHRKEARRGRRRDLDPLLRSGQGLLRSLRSLAMTGSRGARYDIIQLSPVLCS